MPTVRVLHDRARGMGNAALVGMKPLLFLAFLALGPALGDQVSTAPGAVRGSPALSPAALAIACETDPAASPFRERDGLALACRR